MAEYETAYMEVMEITGQDIVTVSEGGNITPGENDYGWKPM